MTTPQQPALGQVPAAQAPSGATPESAPETVPEGAAAPWPPDDATLMQLQMAARFSILDEPAGGEEAQPSAGPGAPAGTTQPPPTPPPGQPQG